MKTPLNLRLFPTVNQNPERQPGTKNFSPLTVSIEGQGLKAYIPGLNEIGMKIGIEIDPGRRVPARSL